MPDSPQDSRPKRTLESLIEDVTGENDSTQPSSPPPPAQEITRAQAPAASRPSLLNASPGSTLKQSPPRSLRNTSTNYFRAAAMTPPGRPQSAPPAPTVCGPEEEPEQEEPQQGGEPELGGEGEPEQEEEHLVESYSLPDQTLIDVAVPEAVLQMLPQTVNNDTLVDATIPDEVRPFESMLQLGLLQSYDDDGNLVNECPLPSSEVLEVFQAKHEHAALYEQLEMFFRLRGNRPLVELESSGQVVFVGMQESSVVLMIGEMADFELFCLTDGVFEGTFGVNEMFEYDKAGLMVNVTRKSEKQLSSTIAGRPCYSRLEFTVYEDAGSNSTWLLKKSRRN